MPIIVVKGSEAYRTKKRSQAALSGVDLDDITFSSTTNDFNESMDEVLNIRVYRISEPHFFTGTQTTSLIGGNIFYSDPEDPAEAVARYQAQQTQHMPVPKTSKADKHENPDENGFKSDIIEEEITNQQVFLSSLPPLRSQRPPQVINPSLLQKIRAFRFLSKTKASQQENSALLKRLRDQCRLVKMGQSLASHLPTITEEEKLQWVLEYINDLNEGLIDMFFELETRLNKYSCNGNTKISSPTRTMGTAGDRRGRFSPDRRATSATRTAQTATLLSNSQYQGNGKSLNLAQQLELIKQQGTDSFLQSVLVDNRRNIVSRSGTATSSSGPPSITRPQGDNTSNNLQHRPSVSFPHRSYRANRSNSSSIPEDQLPQTDDSKLSVKNTSNPSNSTITKPTVSLMTGTIPLDEEDEGDENSTSSSTSIKQEDSISTLRKASTTLTPRKPSVAAKPRSQPQHRQLRSKAASISSSPTKLSSVRETNGADKQGDRSRQDDVALSAQEAIENARRNQQMLEKSVGFTMQLLQKAHKKQEDLQTVVSKKLQRAKKLGNRMFDKIEEFSTEEKVAVTTTQYSREEKQFMRESVLKAKLEFLNDESNYGSIGSSVYRDMHKMRQASGHAVDSKELQTLTSVRWFVDSVAKLKDYLRRMNNTAPPCCLKLIFAVQYLLKLGVLVTTHYFYCVLLSPIFAKEDFRKSIVQQILDIVRDGLSISVEDYIAFLEKNDFQVPPDLLNELRSINIMKELASKKGVSTPLAAITPSPTMAVTSHTVTFSESPVITLDDITLPLSKLIFKEKVEAEEVVPAEVFVLKDSTQENISPSKKTGLLAD